jgi:glycosyltransferase involved in cell wall biosynthesis
MKVGIDIHSIGKQQTGNETYIRNLVDNLIDLDSKNTDYHLFYTHNDKMPTAEHVQQTRISPHQSIFRIPFVFPYQLRKQKIDVAHFQYVVPPVTNCPAVVSIHDISYEYHPEFFNPLECKRMKLLIPFSARKSKQVITISEYSKKQIMEKYNISDNKITVTYCGVDEKFCVLDNDADIERSLLRFGIQKPFILAVGNLQPRKNIERLIRAYSKLRSSGKVDLDLVLVGQVRWGSEAIFEEVESLGVKNNIHITGYVSEEELIALYNKATLFVFPSLYEGFGLPLVEAMACGTPVISSNASCLPEVGGDAAYYFDPYSENGMMKAIEDVANSTSVQEKLIQNGFERASNFSWKSTAENTLKVYEKVVG